MRERVYEQANWDVRMGVFVSASEWISGCNGERVRRWARLRLDNSTETWQILEDSHMVNY